MPVETKGPVAILTEKGKILASKEDGFLYFVDLITEMVDHFPKEIKSDPATKKVLK